MYELQVKELVFSVNYAVWIFGGMQLFLLPLTFFHIIFSLQYQITFCWQMRLDFHLQSNICSILYRGPFRVGVHMSLVWILKPFISCIEEEAMSLSVFCYCICACFRCCPSFNPFVSFVSISSVLCRCFKTMSLVRIYPNRASVPGLLGSSHNALPHYF